MSRRATRISSGWHLDLSDAAAQAWLRRRPWPPDVVEMVAAPIQRGRLFIAPDRAYGHLRDFRDEPDAVTLQAGSLCVVASRTLLVTGLRIPLSRLRSCYAGWKPIRSDRRARAG